MANHLQELAVSSNHWMAKLVPEDAREKKKSLGSSGHLALLGAIFVRNAQK
jgi:hypothetical protein